jgi:isopentenyl-diphosphate Delta-isomerase
MHPEAVCGRNQPDDLCVRACERFCLESVRRPAKDHRMPESKPSEEYFDVVDPDDAVVGRATRREVHACGLLHRAVHVLVFNRAGELFLQKRSLRKDTAPGAWDSSASGHVDAGEDYDACAKRELGEEIGLEVTHPPTRWLRLRACEETGREFVWVYREEAEGPFTPDPEEIECGAWRRPEEIARLVCEQPEEFASSFRLIWRELAARGEVPGESGSPGGSAFPR